MKFLKWERDEDGYKKETIWKAKSCIDGVEYRIHPYSSVAKRTYGLELDVDYAMTNKGGLGYCYVIEKAQDAVCIAPTIRLCKHFAQLFDNILNQRYNGKSIFLMTIRTVKKFFGKCEGLKIENVHPYG